MPFLLPLMLIGSGLTVGYGLFKIADDTADSAASAATSISSMIVVGGIAYLILKKGKVL